MILLGIDPGLDRALAFLDAEPRQLLNVFDPLAGGRALPRDTAEVRGGRAVTVLPSNNFGRVASPLPAGGVPVADATPTLPGSSRSPVSLSRRFCICGKDVSHKAGRAKMCSTRCRVQKRGLAVEIWTPREIAALVERYPVLRVVKQEFPGATVERIRTPLPKGGDEIPL